MMEKVDVFHEELSQPVQPIGRVGHSKLGIASFTIAMISGLLFWGSIVLAIVLEESGASLSEIELQEMILGLVLMLVAFVNLVGTGLGIAGVMSKTKKRVFAILGIVFNVMTILIFILFMIVGLTIT